MVLVHILHFIILFHIYILLDTLGHNQLGFKPVIENGVLASPSLDSLRRSFTSSRTNIRSSRRSILHLSTNSLVSEDPRSISPVPPPSPVPAQNLLRSQPLNSNVHLFLFLQ